MAILECARDRHRDRRKHIGKLEGAPILSLIYHQCITVTKVTRRVLVVVEA